MKSFRWTFVFMIAVGALGAFTYYDYQKSKKETERTEEAKNVVRLPTDQVVKVEILKRDGSELTIEKKGDKWFLTEPIQDLADSQAITSFFLSLRNEKSIETVAAGAEVSSLKTYGLDEPVMRLKLWGADGKHEELKIGSVKAYDSNLYAQIGDEPKVLLVSSSWDIHLAKLPKDLRDKHLLRRDLKIEDVKRIALKYGADASEFELKKKGDKWVVVKGAPEFPVVADKVKFYLDAVKGVRAQDFIEGSKLSGPDLAKNGLGNPSFELRLFTDQKEPVFTTRFATSLAKRADKKDEHGDEPDHGHGPAILKATSSDYSEILMVTRSMLDSLQKPAENFYDRKRPFQFTANEVGRVEVNTRELKGAFLKKDQKWVAVEADLQKEVDGAKLDQAIAKIQSFEAVRVLQPVASSPRKGSGSESTLKLLKASGELLFEIGWDDIVTEKAKAGRPEARYVPVRTTQAENRVGLPEAELKALDLSNWLKAKGAPSSAPEPKKSAPEPALSPTPAGEGARIGEWKGSSDVRNPSEIPDARRSGGRHARLLAAVSLSR